MKYQDSFPERARALCEQGATQAELAEAFDVSALTIHRWASKYAEFGQALKVGKAPADDRVERSLFERANGYTATETKREYEVKEIDGKTVRALVKETIHEKHVAPDVAAAFIWLKNRRPEEWRDRREFTGPDGGPMEFSGLTDMEMARRLVSLIDRAATNQ